MIFKMKYIGLIALLSALLTGLAALDLTAQEAVETTETVEVEGQIYSHELLESKNLVIITRKDLEDMHIKNTADLFSYFTAVDVSRRGPGDSSYDLTMRGSNFEQVLVLVDGVPFNNPQTGHFNTDFPFTVRDVERVEIIRGGTSTTYGAGAFAGVVNIILKKNDTLRLNVSGGENKFYGLSLQAGTKFGPLDVRVSVDRQKSDGYHEGREFEHLKVTGGIHYSRNNLDIDWNGGYLEKDFGAQGFYAPFPSVEEIDTVFSRFRLQKRTGKWHYALSYAYRRHNDFFVLDRYRPGYYSNESLTHQHYIQGTGGYNHKGLKIAVGGELKDESMDSLSMGERQRTTGAFFANLSFLFNKKSGFDAGIRRNLLPGGRSNFTYYAGLFRNLGAFVLRGGYGKSFRSTSFTELYYNSPSNKGDELLEPEVSRNIEVSLSWLRERFHMDVSVFYRDQKNTIDWVKQVSSAPWQAVNIAANDLVGFEITQRWTLGSTKLMIGFERLWALDKPEGFISKYGLRFPDLMVKANILQPIGKRIRVGGNYRYKRIYDTGEQGHFLDLTVSTVWSRLEIGLRMDNVFNTIIEEIPGVEIPGRWMYVTFSYKYD